MFGSYIITHLWCYSMLQHPYNHSEMIHICVLCTNYRAGMNNSKSKANAKEIKVEYYLDFFYQLPLD